ncbi:MAG: Ig-like domain-containing protein, partial [Phycisphaerales bacterium]|nr:Ig-like domain-containing protein [Phycisphaerales bacterium]
MMKLGLMRLVVGVVMMGGVAFSQDIASMPPVVVKTVPEAGATNVPPGEVEIRVTFSKEMRDKSWSWATAWKDSTPETVEPPRYEADRKTCVVKVKLEPGKTYGFWLNSENFGNFKDKDGRSAVPYLLVFQTQKAGAAGTTGAAVVPDEMDKATVKGVASQFLAAVAAKDDKKLQSLCGDRFREWPTGAAVFAAELRQVAEKATGKPFEM